MLASKKYLIKEEVSWRMDISPSSIRLVVIESSVLPMMVHDRRKGAFPKGEGTVMDLS
uniref:Uncharacterized protein n=1 Tax=Lepeophtheirus salmonis TaxID=72036 RepID=A0A0K2TS35_LEPSM